MSAPISDVRYDVTFDSHTAHTRTIKVVMSFTAGGEGPVLLSLPAWTPGSYELDNFARRLSGFAATAGGRALNWDKMDYDTWRLASGKGQSISVSFTFAADTLDNASSWSRLDFAFFNGTNLFMYPEGRSADSPATVTVHTEADWRIATGMTPGTGPRTYTARSYHELVDMPFFVGRFDYDSLQVAERWVRLATYPVGSVAGRTRRDVWNDLARIIPREAAVFGEVPWDTYTILQVTDSSFGGMASLEHANSHLAIYSPLAIGTQLASSFYAHEVFHAWNVKRMRPADLVPYRYDRAQPTPWLWVSEGITSYYGDLAQVRGGVVDSAAFFRLKAADIDEVTSAPPVALEDASLTTWIDPRDGTSQIYYPKGSVAGLMLDILIRDASDNRRSLDDVMRAVYRATYKQGRGFTGDDWWGAVSRAAGGKSFADFARRYVDGREPFPLASVLPLAGMRLLADTARQPLLGVWTQPDSAGLRVTGVDVASAADSAGVRSGDYLVSVAGISVRDEGWGLRYRAKLSRAAEHSRYPLQVRRGADTVTLSAPLNFVTSVRYSVVADSHPSAKASRIRSGLLHGAGAAGEAVSGGARPAADLPRAAPTGAQSRDTS